jgi:hypothetical protein
MNQVSTWDLIKGNYRMKFMSSETSKKRRAAAALAQGREKQIRNITDNEESVPKDLLPGESVKKTHKLDTICNPQEATDPANQRAWIGWIQIEDLATTKAHDMIVKIKLEMEAIQYSEIFEGPNFIVLAVLQHELHTLTNTTFPPSLHYKICYIPANSKIWATNTNIIPTTTNSQIMEGLKKIKGKNTPIGWNVIPTKKNRRCS